MRIFTAASHVARPLHDGATSRPYTLSHSRDVAQFRTGAPAKRSSSLSFFGTAERNRLLSKSLVDQDAAACCSRPSLRQRCSQFDSATHTTIRFRNASASDGVDDGVDKDDVFDFRA